MRNAVALALFLVLGLAAGAQAQGEAVIGLGLAASSYDTLGNQGVGGTTLGPVLRLNLGTGLGPAIGFNWHSMGVETDVDGQRVYLGRLRLRPIMGGIAYNWKRGRTMLSGSLVGGYAFTKLTVNDKARPAFRSSLDASFLAFDTGSAIAVRPQLAVWHDVAPRVGLTASIAYLFVQPSLSIETDRGTVKSRINATSTIVSFGLVYGVF